MNKRKVYDCPSILTEKEEKRFGVQLLSESSLLHISDKKGVCRWLSWYTLGNCLDELCSFMSGYLHLAFLP